MSEFIAISPNFFVKLSIDYFLLSLLVRRRKFWKYTAILYKRDVNEGVGRRRISSFGVTSTLIREWFDGRWTVHREVASGQSGGSVYGVIYIVGYDVGEREVVNMAWLGVA